MKCSIGLCFVYFVLLVVVTEAQWGEPHMGQGPQGGGPPPPPPPQQQQPYYPAPNPPPYNSTTTTTTTTTGPPPAIGCAQQGPYQH